MKLFINIADSSNQFNSMDYYVSGKDLITLLEGQNSELVASLSPCSVGFILAFLHELQEERVQAVRKDLEQDISHNIEVLRRRYVL